ncbi:hypothetical protein [Paludisphaera sp.]|uniref:hypothetical protein n=1 Tax=Paludisphaera sp. TaxID=2017432 RepID=UPI00301DF4C1
MSLWKGIMRGAKALTGGGEALPYIAGGVAVACPHCRGDRFLKAQALRNTVGMTFLNLDWADKSAITLTCDRCGLIQWFAREPRRTASGAKPDREWSD